ncbi:MAG: MBOAT family protein [Lachnospiraceae bacterium]|nr:MBOAT family protein [Lachnospiraceae bacterium]
MIFNSIEFLLFFPIAVLGYYLIPHRVRYLWLLVCSYYFYMCWNPAYALLIFFSTAVTYIAALVMSALAGKKNEKFWKRCCLAGGFVLNLGILVWFKYADFFLLNVGRIAQGIGIKWTPPQLDLLLPVGISFYTFQALGYIMDVYRGETAAEKNFFKYALFVSFFPQLVAGPIERSNNLLSQIQERHRFEFETVRDGLMLMLWGYFLKMVIADRAAIFVDAVYAEEHLYGGWYLIIATMLFALQIYCDFAGYSIIAMGAARVMGFRLTDNFKSPYLAQTVADFWRGWHITLTGWFRDYLYIPLGGNRKGRVRQYVNIMIVFGLSGLWHGASFSFIVWGLLNGFYQVMGKLLQPVRDKAVDVLQINRQAFSHRLYRMIATFLLVDFAWLFFRAGDLGEAVWSIKSMVRAGNIHVLFDGSLFMVGPDAKNFVVLALATGVLLFADYMKRRGIVLREWLCRQGVWFRWLCLYAGVCAVLLFGVYGVGYDETAFIYFQF